MNTPISPVPDQQASGQQDIDQQASDLGQPPSESNQQTPVKPPRERRGPLVSSVVINVVFILLFVGSFVSGNLASGSGTLDILQIFVSSRYSASQETGATGQDGTSEQTASVTQFSDRMDEVAALLNREALHVFTQQELDDATKQAIDGLLAASGDKYAKYFTPSEYKEYRESLDSQFVGIGIQVNANNEGKPTVARVFENSPAAAADVQVGDIIVSVDGQSKEWTVDEVVAAIKRESGQEVTIVWQRNGEELTTSMNVRSVSVPTVSSELMESNGQKVGYLYLMQFSPSSADEISGVIKDLEAQGAGSFILDLRDNPGGLLAQAVDITSMFVPDGAVVQIEDRGNTVVDKVNGKTVTDKPLTVLLNGSSASASELTAAALQDHDRATIIGEQSFGKGTVQDLRELSFGGALKYTVAHYLSPNGTTIDGVGVTPDIPVDDGIDQKALYALSDQIKAAESQPDADQSALEEGIKEAYQNMVYPEGYIWPGDPGYKYIEGADPFLDAALKFLTGDSAK